MEKEITVLKAADKYTNKRCSGLSLLFWVWFLCWFIISVLS